MNDRPYKSVKRLLTFPLSFTIFIFSLVILTTLLSCKTLPITKQVIEDKRQEVTQEKHEDLYITLLFAGDLMAHRPNYIMPSYSVIYDDIKEIVSRAALSFINIEAPVDDSLPFSTYPNFNMHSSYPAAAIKAGFNVFSLVNNHTNDQGLSGIKNTKKWAFSMQNSSLSSSPLYFSGLKEKEEPFSYSIIEKDGWTLLFLAVTEILNRPDYKTYMNYTPYTAEGRAAFTSYVKKMRQEHPCDLFILSIHCEDPEYVDKVTERRREYYYNLLDSGADIIWANHPHIIRERQIIGEKESGLLNKVVMFANGNTISAQRWNPQFNAPLTERDKTGDGLLFKVTYKKSAKEKEGSREEKESAKKEESKKSEKPSIAEFKTHYITTYIDEKENYLIKMLDLSTCSSFIKRGDKWGKYLKSRLEYCEKIKESVIYR